MTPAAKLAEILEGVVGSGKPQTRFIEVVAENLGLVGESAKGIVVSRLFALTSETSSAIEGLPYSDQNKAVARNFLSPLTGFLDFSLYYYTVEQLRQNGLNESSLSGLRSLDMILSPFAGKLVDSQAVFELQNEVRELMNEISKSDLPDELRRLVWLRMSQVHDAIAHFDFLGRDNLQEKIDALVGQVSIQKASASKSAWKIIGKSITLAAKAAGVLILADQAVSAYLSLRENVPLLIEDLSKED